MRWVLLVVMLVFLSATASPGDDGQAGKPSPSLRLAQQIDAHIIQGWKGAEVVAAPRSSDAEFLRRVTLDLTGRIPRSDEVFSFLADKDPDKRTKVIDRLLESTSHPHHLAQVWRSILLPEALSNGEYRYFQPGMEAWLYERFRRNTPYDALVRELLTQELPTEDGQSRPVLTNPTDANALGFFAAKEAKPENLAAATTRLFLGVQLECAQCHDHPFDKWSREQFWQQAAFFAGVERQGRGAFAPLRETVQRKSIKITPEEKITVTPLFLDDTKPMIKETQSNRTLLADWVISNNNPFFAKAAVNRVWSLFFGIGLVDPVDDFQEKNRASHPQLLEELASAFVTSKYDLRLLMRAICLSEAYQRTSVQSHPSQADSRRFARMTVRSMSAEQFFDSLARATGYREPEQNKSAFEADLNSPRGRFLTQFATAAKPVAAETSVAQALTLMNGNFTASASRAQDSITLSAILTLPGASTTDRIEAMYIATLSRMPSQEETKRLLRYIDQADSENYSVRMADIFWVLLNSAEFRLNH